MASFRFRGREIGNHNALLTQIKGVDGIKTGYTDASGYNLVSSLRRDRKHLVAVVLGGSSNGARNARMRQLLEQHIVQASVQRTAPKIVEVALPADYEDFVPVRKAIASTPLPIPRVEPPIAPVLASARTEPASKHTVNKPHTHRARAAAR